MRYSRTLLLPALALAACGAPGTAPPGAAPAPMDRIAEEYVHLVLAVGQHDADYVDAYFGPEEWRTRAETDPPGLDAIRARAEPLVAELRELPAADEEIVELRRVYLLEQLDALVARVRMLAGETMTFDEESMALYGARAPVHEAAYFQAILDELEGLLPGDGPLVARHETFRADFVIPTDRLDAVFRAAIDGCRERTLEHVDLPADESFVVEYVTDRSWSGYNWYQGGHRSLIQVNTDLPIHIDRAVDLACHEGYPGHHVYNVLRERELYEERGWVETTVYPLFSPQSLIAEGSANHGIDVAFPGDERVAFEATVLFPLAGLDPDAAAGYYRVLDLAERLSYAGNEAARRYLNGEIEGAAAADWLETYALMSRPRAEQRVRFIEQYRSYVINYNLGRDLVAGYVAREAGPDADEARRWAVFSELLGSPRLPSGLRQP